MGEYEKLKMICSECGNCPVDVGGDVVVYAKWVRRRVLWVWLGLVFLVGVLGLPWVQVWLGDDWAVFDSQPYRGKFQDQALAKPPVRWRDLERAASGDIASIEQFHKSLTRLLPTQNFFSKAYDEYTFQVGTAQAERYGGDPEDGLMGTFEGELIPFTLVGYQTRSVGWPMKWVVDVRWDRYAYGGARFGEDRLLSVDDDMLRRSTTTRRIHWSNIFFLALVCVGVGVLIRWVLLWQDVDRLRAMIVGVVMSGLLVGVVLIVGSRHREVTDWETLMGRFDPVLSQNQPVWKREVLDVMLESDELTQELARTLVDDFGEMTHPNDLVIIGLTRHDGLVIHDLTFGISGHSLFSIGTTALVRLEPDGTTTRMTMDNFGNRWFGVRPDGVVDVSWRRKKNKISYGFSVNLWNLFLAGGGLWGVWRVFMWVGGWQYRRVQRRRVGRGVCVWCRYPCGV